MMFPSGRRLACFLLVSSPLLACSGRTISYVDPPSGGAAGASGGAAGSTSSTIGTGGTAIPSGGSGGTTSGDIYIRPSSSTKLDLLFLIDNSSSMADKQGVLATAVPELVLSLADPACIDPSTGMAVGNRRPDGSC